jgi:hypothetical protein
VVAVSSESTPACPLCHSPSAFFTSDRLRAYFECPTCAMVFVDPASRPDRAAERAEYDRHRNDPSDPGYRTFLSRLAAPLLERLTPGMEGLDFGSGPGPTLSVMLEQAGMHVTLYDPQYAPRSAVLERRYDFVTATEVVEHFHDPARDWARLASLLKPAGVLGVMTKQPLDRRRFEQWHYKARGDRKRRGDVRQEWPGGGSIKVRACALCLNTCPGVPP